MAKIFAFELKMKKLQKNKRMKEKKKILKILERKMTVQQNMIP